MLRPFWLWGCCFGKFRGFGYARALVWVQLHLHHAYTLSTQLLNSADEGCRMRPFRLNAFLFSAGLGDGFHDDLYDFIDFYYF
jgi:hypothetical protein